MMAGDLPFFLVSAVYLEREGKILILERAAGWRALRDDRSP